jgi:peptidyl-dipeptidase Dcp
VLAARLKQLLSIGNTVEPAEAYRVFRGRDPRVEALMKKRGFTPSATSQ